VKSDRVWRFAAFVALAAGVSGLLGALVSAAALGGFQRVSQLFLLWGAALIAVFVILEFETLGRLISTRGVQGGANIAVRAVALVGIVVLINVLASQRVAKWDLTSLRINTLAPQTLKVLHDLPQPVEVNAFYRPTTPGQAEARRLLERYQKENRDKFRLTIIDPDVRPDLALLAGAGEGTTIFQTASRPVERVESAQEQDFTSALIKLSSTRAVKIYFLTGHGEGVLVGGATALGLARQVLGREGFTVADLSLTEQPAVPPDASAVVVAGGKQPLSDAEVQALVAYLDGGGRAFVMNAPLESGGLSRVIEPYGLAFDKGVVADPTRHAQQTVYAPSTSTYSGSPITKELTNQITFMFNAGPVSKRAVKDVAQTAVWDTSSDAYAVSEKNLNRPFDPAKDKKGPFSLMMSAERKATASASPSPSVAPRPAVRVVAAGSWEFASDRVITSGANAALFLNAVNWVVGQEQLISIPPRTGTAATVVLDSAGRTLLFVGTVLLLPALILLAGVLVWVRRSLRA
jgi:ABC-type uncharacterized transport system involved in gliding motility auxiliary subunit